jgi:hypothetical protein
MLGQVPKPRDEKAAVLMIRTADGKVQEEALEVARRRLQIGAREPRAVEWASGVLAEPGMEAFVAKCMAARCDGGLSEDLHANRAHKLVVGRGQEVVKGGARGRGRGRTHGPNFGPEHPFGGGGRGGPKGLVCGWVGWAWRAVSYL